MARSAGFRRAIPGIAVVALSLALLACGGGSSTPELPVQKDGGAVQLSVHSESLDDSTVRVLVSADDAAELYQLSCRLTYDPVAVRPLTTTPGSLVDQRALFFTSDRPEAYVPVAFTYHPGEAIPAASGTLAVCEFELLDAGSGPAFDLIQDPEFLIAADSLGRKLSLTVEVVQ